MEEPFISVAGVTLTLKQAQTLSIATTGEPRKRSCDLLRISQSTLNQRLVVLHKKSKTDNAVQLAVWAVQNGFDTKGCFKGKPLFDSDEGMPWQKD